VSSVSGVEAVKSDDDGSNEMVLIVAFAAALIALTCVAFAALALHGRAFF
jgi:hypothetical protein